MNFSIKKNILEVKPYIPGKPIEEVKRELGLRQVIKLASNECPLPPSPKVLRAIAQEAKQLNRYPDGGCFKLRQELSKRLKVAANQIIFGNGSDEIIVMAVRVLVADGDEVIVAKPSFLVYEIAAQIAGAVIKTAALKDFRYDLKAMQKAVTAKTRIIFIGNPDNPSSTYIPQGELLKFLKNIRRDICVVIDEAYFEFVDAPDYPDGIELLKEFPNVLATRTFSKMYGLAGLRIGYGIARPEFIEVLERVREPFNVNSLAQAAAIACLNDTSYYRRITTQLNKEKKNYYKNFKQLGLAYVESSTNFILVNVNKDSRQVSQALLKKGVIVRDMDFWGLKNFIRVTVGTPLENKKFMRALKEVVL